jgi:hypothetical protein
MKKQRIFPFVVLLFATGATAQTNTFPSTGNVGIGIAAPGTKLDVNGVSDTTGYIVTRMSSATSGYPAYLQFTDGATYNYAVGTTANGDMTFNTARFPGTAGTERVRITQGGSVGIGTITPGSALEVNGSVTLTSGSGASMKYPDGTVQSTAWNGVLTGGDYAESVNVSGGRGEYEPGDVLVIDPTSEGNFLKSSAPYSTAVTGIYSTKPGVIGRRQLSARTHMKEEVPMAMTGIVPTKVSAENGAIKPGDLLVTSSKPGYAMKGTDRNQMLGAVIGKAIGHLDSGVGVIEAVVTLQ